MKTDSIICGHYRMCVPTHIHLNRQLKIQYTCCFFRNIMGFSIWIFTLKYSDFSCSWDFSTTLSNFEMFYFIENPLFFIRKCDECKINEINKQPRISTCRIFTYIII